MRKSWEGVCLEGKAQFLGKDSTEAILKHPVSHSVSVAHVYHIKSMVKQPIG